MIQYSELTERIRWLIRLRWFAVVGVFSLTGFTSVILHIVTDPIPLYIIGASIAAYNVLFLTYAGKLELKKDWHKHEIRLANLQISVDLIFLALLIHFSGGAENPFVFYFIFHTIIASILLSKKETYLQATLAVFLFGIVVGLEYLGTIPHVHLQNYALYGLYRQPNYILALCFAFPSTLYAAAYMATSIAERLKTRERELSAAREAVEIKARELEETNLKLQQMDRLKSEYVLKVTHELRAPLSTIVSCLRVVTDGFTPKKKQAEMLERAVERTDILLAVVNDLLELSRIKAGKLEQPMEQLDLNQIVQKSVDFMRVQAFNKRILMTVDAPDDLPMINANRQNMEELFINLISNAIKYTTVGGKVTITLKPENNELYIQVADTGIGIPQDDLSKIFDEFCRGANAKACSRQGTGLGLSIVRQIVTLYDGKIWVESVEGKGSKFNLLFKAISEGSIKTRVSNTESVGGCMR